MTTTMNIDNLLNWLLTVLKIAVQVVFFGYGEKDFGLEPCESEEKEVVSFPKLRWALALVPMLLLTGCQQGPRWLPVQVNLAADPAHQFVNLHVTNDFGHEVVINDVWFEIQTGDGWQQVPVNPEAEWLLEGWELGIEESSDVLTTVLPFEAYLYGTPASGTFRIAVRFTDTAGNELETRLSNEFELN